MWQSEMMDMPYVRAYFVEALSRSLNADDLIDPAIVSDVYRHAESSVTPWSGTPPEEFLQRKLGWAEKTWNDVESLAKSTLSHLSASWMWQPLAGTRQVEVWLDANGPVRELPTRESLSKFEVYAGRPYPVMITSTLRPDGTTSFSEGAREITGDLGPMTMPFGTQMLVPSPETRVAEINLPEDWAALCDRFPHVTDGGVVNWPEDWNEYVREHGGKVVTPDFVAMQRELDGLHITWLGVLTTSSLPIHCREGVFISLGFDAECTHWLNPPRGDWQPITLQ